MWIFGQLDTIGRTEAEKSTEASARVVAEKLDGILKGESRD